MPDGRVESGDPLAGLTATSWCGHADRQPDPNDFLHAIADSDDAKHYVAIVQWKRMHRTVFVEAKLAGSSPQARFEGPANIVKTHTVWEDQLNLPPDEVIRVFDQIALRAAGAGMQIVAIVVKYVDVWNGVVKQLNEHLGQIEFVVQVN
jgi:hypothetical protein